MKNKKDNNYISNSHYCTRKIHPHSCLIYMDIYTKCSIQCNFFNAGTPIIPAFYPNLRIDCQYLARAGDVFFCVYFPEGRVDEELECRHCSAYKRQIALQESLTV
ncbi:MAG: hypothetical protein ACFFC7_04385 [Candidatus Hermodarchaeota archaeon]